MFWKFFGKTFWAIQRFHHLQTPLLAQQSILRQKPNAAGRGDFRYCSHWLTWLATSLSILQWFIRSANKCNRDIYMLHWMLVTPRALKSMLPVAESFSNKEMRTFCHFVAMVHINLQVKHSTQVCEGEKQSQLLSTTSPLWFRRRIRLVVHFRDKFLSFLCCGTSCFQNDFSSQCQKEPVSYFNQYSRIFFGIFAGQRAQRPISLPPVIASDISSIVFSMTHLDVLLLLHCWLN